MAILANTARNLTKAQTSTGSSTQKSTATYQTVAQNLIQGGTKTLEQLNTVLASKTGLTTEQKAGIVEAFKNELGWKAPLNAGVTQYENNATVEAYKSANNIK